jgi:alpha-tubulin suppressor-like RCC1 family protein
VCRSVYALGCGRGGKLGHGSRDSLRFPNLIQHFQAFNVKPLSIAAGAFHCAVLALDGRVFTWGRSGTGCLGHHVARCETLPKEVVGGLKGVKARHLSCGYYNTFVIADDGNVYSFGWGGSLNLGVEVWSLPSNSHKSRSNNQLTTKYRIKTSEFLIVRFTSVGFRRRARMSGVPS